jgi:hypothetical protein
MRVMRVMRRLPARPKGAKGDFFIKGSTSKLVVTLS